MYNVVLQHMLQTHPRTRPAIIFLVVPATHTPTHARARTMHSQSARPRDLARASRHRPTLLQPRHARHYCRQYSTQITIATGLMPAAGEGPRGSAVVDLCEAFKRTRSIRYLVIRKNAYLTHSNAIHVFEQLAKAISRSPKFVSLCFSICRVPASPRPLRLCMCAVVESATLHCDSRTCTKS